VLLWPNIDAGADRISKAIRVFRTEKKPEWLRTLTNLPPDDYLRVLARTACAIGNSSSFVRDAGYFGTPVVIVGDRQRGRESDRNVVFAPPVRGLIETAARNQLAAGRYQRSELYGDGYVAGRLATALVGLNPYVQKHLHYIDTERSAAAGAGVARMPLAAGAD
jgi:hypothetical protein